MGAAQDSQGNGSDTDQGSHQTTVRVRYGEVDRMGVAYHAHYLVYFEMGRTEYLRSMGFSYREFEELGHLLVVVDAGVKYLKPARYDDELTIRTRIASWAGVRLRFEYEAWRGRQRLATGHTVLACTTAAGRPCRFPEAMRTAIQAAVLAQEHQKVGASVDACGRSTGSRASNTESAGLDRAGFRSRGVPESEVEASSSKRGQN